MSVLDILRWPDPRLAETCAPVEAITPEIERLAAAMLATCLLYPSPSPRD